MATNKYVAAISASGLSIYDPITVGDPNLWIPTNELEAILNSALIGLNLQGLALRTRSKVVKSAICKALGYPVPKSFVKTQPRFPGQDFDAYTQKNNNLQIWNEEITATRRYVLIRTDAQDVVCMVKVLTGEEVTKMDTTGTLTTKYQAKLIGRIGTELSTQADTDTLKPLLASTNPANFTTSPTDNPQTGYILPISVAFDQLKGLVGKTFKDLGPVQERNRGAELHKLVCSALGYGSYGDDGQFPDVRH